MTPQTEKFKAESEFAQGSGIDLLSKIKGRFFCRADGIHG